jgi:hypothetical protein
MMMLRFGGRFVVEPKAVVAPLLKQQQRHRSYTAIKRY